MAAPKTTAATVEKEVLSTVLLFNKASLALNEAVASAVKIEERVLSAEEAFNKKSLELANLVDEKKTEISGLDAQLAEETRIKSLDVDLKIKQYGINSASTYLSNTHTILLKDEYSTLIKKVAEAEATTKKEVAMSVATVKSEYETKLATQIADSKVAAATDTAKIAALQAQVDFQAKQIATLESMISSEREASIERAKAATPNFNLPSSGK